MATIRNKTNDTRTLFAADAPPIHGADCQECGGGCNEVTVSDEKVAGRAWARSTWEFVTPPEGLVDVGDTDEDDGAYLYVTEEEAEALAPVDLDAMTVPQLKKYAAANAIDLGDATTKADIRAAIDSHQEG